MRRGAVFALAAIALVVALITTGIAVLVDWLPEQASEEREGIDFVLWLTVGICIFVFAVVASIAIYAGLKFRVRPDDDSDGAPIHGHTGIEVVWTVVPAILVTIILVASVVVLGRNDNAGANPLTVEVLGQQFAWQFSYPASEGVESTNLYLPVGRSTRLVLRARDVIHSFWVPEFGQKQDLVPGIVTTLVVTPTKVGEYRIICTELCGLGHGLMRSRAVVLSQAEFDAWVEERQAEDGGAGGGGEEPDDVGRLFTQTCGSCHTLEKAGTSGTIGPSLDGLTLDRAAIEEQIRSGGGGMPAFQDRLSPEQISALVQYLAEGNE